MEGFGMLPQFAKLLEKYLINYITIFAPTLKSQDFACFLSLKYDGHFFL